ncbi:MAG TPA: transcription-repair coupling factor [Planctomycetes bacterium]|nr:transcription-repair coupling factor [Planctomycetota bacterium]
MSASSFADRDPIVDRIINDSSAIATLLERLATSGVVEVSRCGEGPTGLLIAALSERLGRPLLVLTSSPDGAERLRRDAGTFTDEPIGSFPMWESLFEEDSEPDTDTFRERTEAARSLVDGSLKTVVAPVQAVLQPISRDAGSDPRIVLRVGDRISPGDLARSLVDAGYRRFPQVARPGDFSVRGGIFDIYPREGVHPYRIDFFDEEIDSISTVSVSDGRSGEQVEMVVLTLEPKENWFIRGFTGKERLLFDLLPEDAVLAVWNPQEVEEKARFLVGQWSGRREKAVLDEFWARAGRNTRLQLDQFVPEQGRGAINLPVISAEAFQGSMESSIVAIGEEVARGGEVVVFFRQEAEVERFGEVLEEASIEGNCRTRIGDISSGFRWQEDGGGVLVSGSAALGRSRSLERKQKKRAEGRIVDSFLELEEGSLVVHIAHGIARFRGIRNVKRGFRRGDFLVLEFSEGVQLLVPVERIDLVQKYIGGGGRHARLDKISGTAWSKRKAKVEEGLHDLASEMLEIQALRAERPGHSFAEDSHQQKEFDASFPFEETPDQLQSMITVSSDLQAPRPMDRLICGDVGYGKTEVAMRAAFKVVQEGKQVAVLVPTTVLAQQHLVTFRDRMAEFPVRIDAISRFRSRKEQTEIIERASSGKLDILIGTHRLLSGDVHFKDLGLIVIDEEQRFGVAHKERLKHLRRLVDILTLTATPIPRTLHLSLVGAKDISSLNDPPEGRNAIHTEVCHYEEARFREIILRELNRDGQVFYLHNRVRTIHNCCEKLRRLIPEAVIAEVHGQMNEHHLEEKMVSFIEKKTNVLVTTSIIESGLDIPSANTLIVERADRFGLSQLHQLRGRVGRGSHRAYCYLLVPEDRPIAPDARHRLQAIEEYSQLGAGFQIAMRDLEIRGAGNILGKEQSGHIATVGYDLYCRLLERAVAQIRGTPWEEPPDVEVVLAGECRIPEEYLTDTRQRLRIYRSIATALQGAVLDDIAVDLIETCGPLPEETARLIALQRLRIRLGSWGVRRCWTEDGWLLVTGDRSAARRGLMGLGWELLDLPDGQLAGRPKGESNSIEDLDSVLNLFSITTSAKA